MKSNSAFRLFSEQSHILLQLLRWLGIASCAGVLGGSASALLLASLNLATDVRESHLWLIALLPLAGLFVGCLYRYLGSSVEAGNNLILEEVHEEVQHPRGTIPLRMTPLILLGTFLTHLFGGSAGREGTAIQTGASLADQLTRLFRLRRGDRRILLMAGISAGFGSVFGTPLAGAVFGIEVLAIGRLSYAAIFPCFVGAFVGDLTTRAWHVHHTVYTVTQLAPMTPRNLLAACAAGIAFGVTAMLFAKATHAISHFMKKHIAWGPARPLLGGIVVALAVAAVHTTRYIGLGVPVIVESFQHPLHWYDFAAKFAFTAVTLGTGFKGGEVTPLFYIGSTLGNALAHILPLPTSLLAGMGFVAVFAGAANTPIASSLMAVELFGAEAGAFAAIACVVSYLFSGHSGIYHAQRLGSSKHAALTHEEGLSLALIAKQREEKQTRLQRWKQRVAERHAKKPSDPAKH
ncbi:voltage-gated chloride channel family protein [Silvibacterium sp.]|uniref:voltage-gated chloride channel family protein n=1 Tax=Silvibacterium sp. TaxID=1964179 RepID=UPI0039E490B4